MVEKEKRVAATKLREQFTDILNRAAYSGEHFLVHRYGQDLIRIIPARIINPGEGRDSEQKKNAPKD